MLLEICKNAHIGAVALRFRMGLSLCYLGQSHMTSLKPHFYLL